MDFSSPLITNAVEEVAKLPGIGKKSALRIVLHLLKKPKDKTNALSFALTNLRDNIKYCPQCHYFSEGGLCQICEDKKRDDSIICIVTDIPDVIAIENTLQYKGRYHVLGGVISPIEGVGPDDVNIESLLNRLKQEGNTVKEVMMALSATLEGDTTAHFIAKKIEGLGIKVTSLARGLPVGGELEYADEITLGRSIQTRRNL